MINYYYKTNSEGDRSFVSDSTVVEDSTQNVKIVGSDSETRRGGEKRVKTVEWKYWQKQTQWFTTKRFVYQLSITTWALEEKITNTFFSEKWI